MSQTSGAGTAGSRDTVTGGSTSTARGGGGSGGSDRGDRASGGRQSGGAAAASNSGGSAGAESSGGGGSATTPLAIQFLVDSSGSNNEREGSTTHWEVTQAILTETFAGLDPATITSLIFFPNPNFRPGSGECIERNAAVPFAATDDAQVQKLGNALLQREPEGMTPTHDAFRFAVESLLGAGFTGDRYVALVTDGVPTVSLECMGTQTADPVDPAPVIADIENTLAQHGIRTIVVGTPGSEDARATLSRMAVAGGSAPANCDIDGPNFCHIDLTVNLDLLGQFQSVLSLDR
jgi:hypothetical protein